VFGSAFVGATPMGAAGDWVAGALHRAEAACGAVAVAVAGRSTGVGKDASFTAATAVKTGADCG